MPSQKHMDHLMISFSAEAKTVQVEIVQSWQNVDSERLRDGPGKVETSLRTVWARSRILSRI